MSKLTGRKKTLLIVAALLVAAFLTCCVVLLVIGTIQNTIATLAGWTPTPTRTPTLTKTPRPTRTPRPTATPRPTRTLKPTETPTLAPAPTDTPSPTNMPVPTDTPAPTNTPLPTDTPTPEPEPAVYSGSGDSVIDIEKPSLINLIHIVGNAAGRHFSVTSYDADGNHVDLLVNTTEPYDGYRPLDFKNGEDTRRLEVKATGEWRVEILPWTRALWNAHVLNVPGSFEGSGDNVVFLDGGTPDLAKITGNAAGRYFGVVGYNGGVSLLVNATEPYDGSVILRDGISILEVKAIGEWIITITGK